MKLTGRAKHTRAASISSGVKVSVGPVWVGPVWVGPASLTPSPPPASAR